MFRIHFILMWIWIRRFHLEIVDPDPDPVPDPTYNRKKKLFFYFLIFFWKRCITQNCAIYKLIFHESNFFKKYDILITLADIYASLSRFFFATRMIRIHVSWSGSRSGQMIRIRNTGGNNGTLDGQGDCLLSRDIEGRVHVAPWTSNIQIYILTIFDSLAGI